MMGFGWNEGKKTQMPPLVPNHNCGGYSMSPGPGCVRTGFHAQKCSKSRQRNESNPNSQVLCHRTLSNSKCEPRPTDMKHVNQPALLCAICKLGIHNMTSEIRGSATQGVSEWLNAVSAPGEHLIKVKTTKMMMVVMMSVIPVHTGMWGPVAQPSGLS